MYFHFLTNLTLSALSEIYLKLDASNNNTNLDDYAYLG